MIIKESGGFHIFAEGQHMRGPFATRALAERVQNSAEYQQELARVRREREEEESNVVFAVGGGGSVSGGGAPVTGTAVDLFIDFEFGTNGVAYTTGNLDSATKKTAAAAGSWSIPGNPIICSTTSSFQTGARQFKVNNVGYPDLGAKCIQRTTTTPDHWLATYTLTTPAPQVSCGFALFHTGEATFNFYNWGELTGTAGEYNALHHRDYAPSQIGCEDIGSHIGSLITLNATQYYWITMLYDKTNNTIKLRAYNPSAAWAQVGSESSLVSAPALNTNCNRISFGRTDAHGVYGTFTFRIDCAAICLSTGVGATFPLLPT